MANWGNYVYSPTGSGGYWCTGIQVTRLWETASAIAYQVDCIVYCHYGWDVSAHGSCSANVTSGVNDGTTSASWSGSIYSPTGQDTQVTKCSFSVQYAKYYGQTRPVTFSASNTVTGGFGNGTSTASWSVSIAARSDYNAPAAPTGCSAARASDARVNVSWANGSSTAAAPRSQVRVERSVDGGSWAQVASLGASATSYADTSVSSNHRYRYRVRSYGSGGYSTYSTSGYVYTTPSSPTGCSASRSSDSSVTVRWSRGSNAGATYTGQRVERSVDGGSWAQVATPAATATSWTDTSTSANHRYQYRVRAYNGLYSGYATSGYVYTTPSAPSGCSVSRVSDSSQRVTWSLGSNAAASYQNVLVERQTDSGSWVQVATLGATVTNWTDNSTSANHRYAYRVRSSNSGGRSGYATSGYVYTTPKAPSSATASATGPTTVSVTASGLPAWYDGFQVEHRSGASGAWGETKTSTTLPVSMASVAGLNYYRVRAYKGSLYSAWVETSGITTVSQPLAPAVTGVASVYGVGQTMSVSWVPNHPDGSAQVAAQVEVTGPDGEPQVSDVTGSATSFSVGELGTAGTWGVRVRTKGAWSEGDGWGEWSSRSQAEVYEWPQAAFTSPASDGELVDRLPMESTWQVVDATGVAAQTLEVLGDGGAVLHSVTLGTGVRSYELGVNTYMLANSSSYTLRLTVRAGSTLTVSVERQFVTEWSTPAEPSGSVDWDDDLGATVTVGAGYEEGAPETTGLSVSRVAPDGTEYFFGGLLQSGQSARDPLPPLGVDFAYRVYAHTEAGVTSVTEVPARVDTWDWAYSFGAGASVCVRLSDGQEWSTRPSRGRELYHFADGGESGGLPMAYESDVLDVEGSQSFSVVDDPEAVRRLWLASRTYSVGWVRDPFGGRAYAAVDVSLSGGVAPGVYSVSVSTSELVFEEAVSE